MSNQEALTFTGELDPTIQHILNRPSLKWIFVGGKGGVGKTTNSSCLAVQLAKVRQSVLIISTDPAHNLSDAFNQKFTKSPTLVQGFQNLYAMEIDPNIETDDIFGEQLNNHPEMAMFQDMALNFPGIDEAMSFAEVMKQVQSMQFSTIIFDTAPTGHTLRLLSFPSTLEKVLGKLTSLKSKFGGMFQQFSSMLNLGADSEEAMNSKMESTLKVIREINKQFTNPEMTTFVCVCIPEFLSLYETERLIQELAKFQIDTDTIIVNQVLFPEEGNHLENGSNWKDSKCELCIARSNMQKKYLRQIHDLYEDFHVLILPLLKYEIRGVEKLEQFGQYQLKPYPGIKKLQF